MFLRVSVSRGSLFPGGMALPPPPYGLTNTCKNITFPQLRLRAVINKITFNMKRPNGFE